MDHGKITASLLNLPSALMTTVHSLAPCSMLVQLLTWMVLESGLIIYL